MWCCRESEVQSFESSVFIRSLSACELHVPEEECLSYRHPLVSMTGGGPPFQARSERIDHNVGKL